MKSSGTKPLNLVFLLFFLFLISACSTPSWFPLQKGPPHKAKMKELIDKEVIIIDRQEYVKVLNPQGSEGGKSPKYLYIPVEEYLAKRDVYTAKTPRVETQKAQMEEGIPVPTPIVSVGETISAPVLTSPLIPLKKKVLIAHFDDRALSQEETLGDWLAEKLGREMAQRSSNVLFVDYQMVKEFLQKGGEPLSGDDFLKNSKMLNEVFGIHIIITGELSGPYVFTTKGAKDQEMASSAIMKIETRIIDTLSGKMIKSLSTQNPIVPTKERGLFADEKAKGRAFDLTISELSRSLLRELNRLDWFCRIAKIEGETIYLNAGKLSGVKVGDVLAVFDPKRLGEKGDAKGKIEILTTFGMDASIGKSIDGNKPEAEDILKFSERRGS